MPNLGCLLGAAYQVQVSRLSEILTASGLEITVPEYMVLRALFTRDGMQQCEIGEMIGKDKAAICRTVKAMEKKNLVRTEPVSRKCLKVHLTDRGRQMKPVIGKIAEDRQATLEKVLSPNEVTALETALKKILYQTN